MKLLLCIFLPFLIVANEQSEVSKLRSLLVLQDYSLAMQEAKKEIALYPESQEICLMALKIFAKGGDEDEMLLCFHRLKKEHEREALEEMAWGVIEKGSRASAPLMRAIALIAAAIGNDARGVEILREKSSDPHRLVRGLAVEFASHFQDEALQEMVIDRLKLEKDGTVREALLRAVGLMQIKSLEKELIAVLELERSSLEAKGAALASLVDLKEKVTPEEIQKLIQSNRAGLRALAAELILMQNKKEDLPLLIPLLKDPHGDVRRTAVYTLGVLRGEIDQSLINDSSPETAITAAFALTLSQPEKGQKALEKWLKSTHADERLYAAAALKAAGKYGYPLALNIFNETEDVFVKLNLGVGLIQERIDPELGAQGIYEVITRHKGRLAETDFGKFSAIGPCNVNHRPDIPHYPEAVNQMTRLELLNLLAIQKYPKAMDAVLDFLNERPWGVSGAASALLLTEGDEEALELIRQLLKNGVEKVQLQAALILALWGNDPEALETLQRLYFKVAIDKKEQILEALGKIGDDSALPFLVERLKAPQAMIRMIAATAILQTLYH